MVDFILTSLKGNLVRVFKHMKVTFKEDEDRIRCNRLKL